jgi:hypothetical protein
MSRATAQTVPEESWLPGQLNALADIFAELAAGVR